MACRQRWQLEVVDERKVSTPPRRRQEVNPRVESKEMPTPTTHRVVIRAQLVMRSEFQRIVKAQGVVEQESQPDERDRTGGRQQGSPNPPTFTPGLSHRHQQDHRPKQHIRPRPDGQSVSQTSRRQPSPALIWPVTRLPQRQQGQHRQRIAATDRHLENFSPWQNDRREHRQTQRQRATPPPPRARFPGSSAATSNRASRHWPRNLWREKTTTASLCQR